LECYSARRFLDDRAFASCGFARAQIKSSGISAPKNLDSSWVHAGCCRGSWHEQKEPGLSLDNRTIPTAPVLAEAVLFLHLLWCGWVLLGWTVTHRRRLLRTLHIVSIVYAIVIQLVPWPPCLLTVVEAWLETRAGIEPAHRPFLVRVLDAVVYPDLPEWLIVGCAVLACSLVLLVYLRRYHRRTACGQW
jgi:hypothetical protein